MGKFQLNKKGDDPIKIYEDTFKVANSTVETHLGKLGKMPNPISSESDGTDHDNDGDIDSEDYLKSRDIAIKSNTEERYTNALWKSVEAIASEGKDAYGNYDSHSMPPASGYTGRNWDSRSDIEQQADVDQKIKNVLDVESLASEDYGNMNLIQNPDSDSDGYPMDQEGYARSSWDDASIQDRKNWLFVAGYDSERGDEYKPYFSLDSHIRAQLAKDLHIGGIYAMGTGSL
jgi:hypothetical protein|tara:strand:- start:3666 stop:4358 length:693 start_codon:yes stop_codon:yes gene_type:complete